MMKLPIFLSAINKSHKKNMSEDTKEIPESWNCFMEFHRERFCDMRAKGIASRDTLEFPIYWDRAVPVLEHLFYTYRYYLSEIKDFVAEKGDNDIIEVDKIRDICDCILNAYNKAKKWKTESAVDTLKNSIYIKDILSSCIHTITQDTDLYRLRGDRDNLFRKNDFMHVPFDQIYLCNSMRFSLPGEPCMYLGYSREVCRIELGMKEGGSMGHFKTKEKFNVIDLTLNCQRNSFANLFELWPVLAACYITPPDRIGSYKEEYVFPQVIMQYIKDSFSDIKGIRYYTCRNPDLDASSEEYLNVALFAKQKKSRVVKLDINMNYPFPITTRFDKELSKRLDFVQ